mgnify:CR=1 FL=1
MSSTVSESTFRSRLDRARAEMARTGVDALILSLGHDMPYLMASYTRKGDRGPVVDPGGQIASGVMVRIASSYPSIFLLP